MTRRITKLAAVYLLLGLAATWAVAWGSATLWTPVEPASGFFVVETQPPYRVLFLRECFAGRAVTLWDAVDPQIEHWPSTPSRTLTGIERLARVNGMSPGFTPTVCFTVEARGWPWLALRCETIAPLKPGTQPVFFNAAGPFRSSGAISLEVSGLAINRETRTTLLPYVPCLPGLLADTLFYALLFAGLHQLAAWGRRTRRRKRGRCAACGYDLSGIHSLTCPECGWKR